MNRQLAVGLQRKQAVIDKTNLHPAAFAGSDGVGDKDRVTALQSTLVTIAGCGGDITLDHDDVTRNVSSMGRQAEDGGEKQGGECQSGCFK